MAQAGSSMQGKVCLVTGASSGLGFVTARGLARLGATVVMVCRNQQKGEAEQAEIKTASGNDKVDLLLADLSSQQSIRQLADEFKRKYDRLDVLVNCAGGVRGKRELTADGYEQTFALNHLGYFLLTNLLLDTLKASAPSRIVSVASEAQSFGRINFDDLMGAKKYSAWGAYGQSKLANVMFTYELARQLAGSGVTANAVHPGVVRSGFGGDFGGIIGLGMKLIRPFEITPERGAQTIIYLATSPEVEGVSGEYFSNKKPIKSKKQSYDVADQQRLWQVSEQLTAARSALL